MQYTQDDIPLDNYDSLRQLLCLSKENADLPAKVVSEYWRLKRLHDRADARLDGRALALMCYSLGYGEANDTEAAGPSAIELWETGELKSGDPVSVQWQGKECSAVIRSVGANGRIRIQLEGEDKERSVDGGAVKALAAA